MIPKANRVSKKEFDRIIASRMSFFGDSMSFKAFKDNGTGVSRFAAVVSKKVSAKAHVRNTLRRKVYAALTPLLKDTKPGFTGAFFLKKESIGKDHAALAEEIAMLLRKSAVL